MKKFYFSKIIMLFLISSLTYAQDFNEPFDSGSLPSNFEIFNPENDIQWQYNLSSANGIGSGSVFMNNFDYNTTGTLDWIILPSLNTGSSATLTFDVAYARYNPYCDGLVVAIAVDGSNTYSPIYDKECSVLATAPDQTTFFVPSSSQWRTETVIGLPVNQNNVRIAFINRGDYGQSIYIDNITVSNSVLNTNDFNSVTNITIFPNPSNGIYKIDTKEEVTLEVYDVIGKKITTKLCTIGTNELDITSFANGVYLINATNANGSIKNYKLIKQ